MSYVAAIITRNGVEVEQIDPVWSTRCEGTVIYLSNGAHEYGFDLSVLKVELVIKEKSA